MSFLLVEMGAPDERSPTWKGKVVRADHVDPDPACLAIGGKETLVIPSDSTAPPLIFPPCLLSARPSTSGTPRATPIPPFLDLRAGIYRQRTI